MGFTAHVSVAQNLPINEKNRLKNGFSFILIFAFFAFLPPLQLHRAFGYRFSKLGIISERFEILE